MNFRYGWIMEFSLQTNGHTEFINITDRIEEFTRQSNVSEGIAVVFCKHTTTSIILSDDEEGLKNDIRNALEKIAPEDGDYEHNSPGDQNGFAHIRSVLLGSSVTIPIEKGQLNLGTWQRIFLVDFDERPRERKISVTYVS
jgi:secondary thiamine-phosphate synthase enzyme